MKILITGGSGQLGFHVVEALRQTHDVGVLDLKPPRQDVPYHDVSVLDLDGLTAALRGYDRVVHLAAIDDGVDASDHTYFSTNVQGSWNIMYAARGADISHVVLASSCAAFGLGAGRSPDYLPIDEDHPLRPQDVYPLSKQVIENIAAGFARSGMTALCLRPTLILRPEAVPEIVTLLNRLGADEGGQGLVTGAREYPEGWLPAMRTYVTSEDAAMAFAAATTADLDGFHKFIVSAKNTIGGVATLPLFERLFTDLPPIADLARFSERPDASPLSIHAISETIGWTPDFDWSSVMARLKSDLADTAQ